MYLAIKLLTSCHRHNRKVTLVTNVGVVHVTLFFQFCRMWSLLGVDFYSGFKGSPGRPGNMPLRGRCVQLWEQSWKCSRDHKYSEMLGTWSVYQVKPQAVSRVTPSGHVDATEVMGMRLPKPTAPGTRYAATGLNVCPHGFQSCLIQSFSILLCLSFKMGIFSLCCYNL